MRFWLSSTSGVTIHRQLATQIVLGILGGDLAPGQKLPSTRELARRFRIHANTVSGVYTELEAQGWLELRRGSGVYIRERTPEVPPSAESALDQLIANLFRSARDLRIPESRVRLRLRQWMAARQSSRFLIVEPDDELRAILAQEIRTAAGAGARVTDARDCPPPRALAGAILVMLPTLADRLRADLPAEADCLVLQLRSAPAALASHLPAPPDVLVGVASRWPEFLRLARTMLLAAGFEPERLVVRNACEPQWKRGLASTAAVVCDCLTHTRLPAGCRALPFPVLAESAIADIKLAAASLPKVPRRPSRRRDGSAT